MEFGYLEPACESEFTTESFGNFLLSVLKLKSLPQKPLSAGTKNEMAQSE